VSKIVKKVSQNCNFLQKNKIMHVPIKNLSKLKWGRVGGENSRFKAFGVSVADRPKAKNCLGPASVQS
jgi:hypothetical protein